MPNPLDAWLEELSAALGVNRDAFERDTILDVARDAAHGVSRPSAPLTTFLVGFAAGVKGGDTQAVKAAAETATRLANAHAAEHPEAEGERHER